MLVTHEEILKELSKRTGYPYEQLRILFVDFFHQVKLNLTTPFGNFISGVRCRNSFKFKVNPKALMNEWYYKYVRHDKFNTYRAWDLNKQIKILLENEKFTQKQQDFVNTHWRPQEGDPREQGTVKANEEG